MTYFLNYLLLFCVNFLNLKIGGKFFFNSFGFSHKDYINLISRINSIIHTIIITNICNNFLTGKINQEIFIENLEITKAYIIYDFLILFYYFKEMNSPYLMIIHHIVFLISLFSNKLNMYPYYVAEGLFSEITNIPLYMCWFLLKIKKTKISLFLTNSVITITLFYKFRVITFTKLFLISLSEQEHNESIILFIIMSLNIYWFVLLIMKFMESIF